MAPPTSKPATSPLKLRVCTTDYHTYPAGEQDPKKQHKLLPERLAQIQVEEHLMSIKDYQTKFIEKMSEKDKKALYDQLQKEPSVDAYVEANGNPNPQKKLDPNKWYEFGSLPLRSHFTPDLSILAWAWMGKVDEREVCAIVNEQNKPKAAVTTGGVLAANKGVAELHPLKIKKSALSGYTDKITETPAELSSEDLAQTTAKEEKLWRQLPGSNGSPLYFTPQEYLYLLVHLIMMGVQKPWELLRPGPIAPPEGATTIAKGMPGSEAYPTTVKEMVDARKIGTWRPYYLRVDKIRKEQLDQLKQSALTILVQEGGRGLQDEMNEDRVVAIQNAFTVLARFAMGGTAVSLPQAVGLEMESWTADAQQTFAEYKNKVGELIPAAPLGTASDTQYEPVNENIPEDLLAFLVVGLEQEAQVAMLSLSLNDAIYRNDTGAFEGTTSILVKKDKALLQTLEILIGKVQKHLVPNQQLGNSDPWMVLARVNQSLAQCVAQIDQKAQTKASQVWQEDLTKRSQEWQEKLTKEGQAFQKDLTETSTKASLDVANKGVESANTGLWIAGITGGAMLLVGLAGIFQKEIRSFVLSFYDALEKNTDNLTEQAKAGKLEGVNLAYRLVEVVRIVTIMMGGGSPILIGPNGVGKTEIIKGIVDLITKFATKKITVEQLVEKFDEAGRQIGELCKELAEDNYIIRKIKQANVAEAGGHIGELEGLLQRIFDRIAKKLAEKNERHVPFYDETHTVATAGSGGGGRDGPTLEGRATNVMKDNVGPNKAQIIGASTVPEWVKIVASESGRPFAQRLTPVWVGDPNYQGTYEMAVAKADVLGAKLGRRYPAILITNEAIEAAIQIADVNRATTQRIPHEWRVLLPIIPDDVQYLRDGLPREAIDKVLPEVINAKRLKIKFDRTLSKEQKDQALSVLMADDVVDWATTNGKRVSNDSPEQIQFWNRPPPAQAAQSAAPSAPPGGFVTPDVFIRPVEALVEYVVIKPAQALVRGAEYVGNAIGTVAEPTGVARFAPSMPQMVVKTGLEGFYDVAINPAEIRAALRAAGDGVAEAWEQLSPEGRPIETVQDLVRAVGLDACGAAVARAQAASADGHVAVADLLFEIIVEDVERRTGTHTLPEQRASMATVFREKMAESRHVGNAEGNGKARPEKGSDKEDRPLERIEFDPVKFGKP